MLSYFSSSQMGGGSARKEGVGGGLGPREHELDRLENPEPS
jgi:hypothetical protein